MFSNIHYSTGISSDHSTVAITAKASACVNSETGKTLPSLIKVGVLFHLITNSVFAKLYRKVSWLVSPICEKSMLDKSLVCIIAYVLKVFNISIRFYVGTFVSNVGAFTNVPLLPLLPWSVTVVPVPPLLSPILQ